MRNLSQDIFKDYLKGKKVNPQRNKQEIIKTSSF